MSDNNFRIYKSIEDVPIEWDLYGNDIFLQIPYLTAQETASPYNIDYFYVAVYQNQNIAAKLVVQRIRVKGKEIFKSENKFKEELLNLLNLNLLCVGNIKLTGEHAWEIYSEINLPQFLSALHKILNEIRKISKRDNLPIQLMLVKDFYKDSMIDLQKNFSDYETLSVQPNMLFEPSPNWQSFDDYLAAMRTKYRTRAKRAFKKAEKVVFKELNYKDTVDSNAILYSLYLNVYDSAGFSLYKLPENFFVEMKKELPKSFKIFGGYIGEELVCFYSLITNGAQLEAGFLGYNANLQTDMQLYLNMLYRMIEFTIVHGFKLIDFSRTALEIKSSVGAEPRQMFGFLKHTHPLMNKILHSTFKKFYQEENWIPRNPFKD